MSERHPDRGTEDFAPQGRDPAPKQDPFRQTADSAPPAGEAQEPEPETPPSEPSSPKAFLPPIPQVSRVGKTSVLLVLVAVLALMTVLSFRYSRQAAPRDRTEEPATGFSETPLDPSQIERFEPEVPPSPVAPFEPPEPHPLVERLQALQRAQEVADQRAREPRPPEPLASLRNRRQREPIERSLSAPLEVRRPTGRQSINGAARAASDPGGDLLASALRGVSLPSVTQEPSPETPAPDPRVLAAPEAGSQDPPPAPVSPAPLGPVLREGTVLPAVLTHRLRSDLAGPVQAMLARDVYDSVSYRHLLLPRGTVALGRQSRQPLFGESRLVVLWHRLLLPDGRSVSLDASPATGQDGALGLPGRVSHHWGKRFAAVGLLSLAGAGVQLSQPQRSASGLEAPDAGQLAAGELGLQIGRLSQEILRQAVRVPPTVSASPGSRIGILVTRDLIFPRHTHEEPAR